MDLLEGAYSDLPEGDDDPAWIGIGYIVADVGALLVLIALIVGGIGVRRLGKGGGSGPPEGLDDHRLDRARRRARGRLGHGRQAELDAVPVQHA